MGWEFIPAEESAGAGGAIVEVASQRVTRLGGVLARRRPPTASPSSRRMPEPNTGNRNSHGSRVESWCRPAPPCPVATPPSDAPASIPEELERREARLKKLAEARAKIEARASERLARSRRNTKPRWRRVRPTPRHTARSAAASRRRRR